MSHIRSYRFQLRLKPAQERLLRRWSGGLRWIWNRAIAKQLERRNRGETYANYAHMCKWLTEWRNDPSTAWLSEGPVAPQQQVLKRLHAAYSRFFTKGGGYPKFHVRGQEQGLRFPNPTYIEVDQENSRIKVMKLGWVRARLSQAIPGVLKNATLKWKGGRWFGIVQVELPDVLPAAGVAPTLGIDLGLKTFATASDGSQITPLAALEKKQRRLKRYQRAVSRKCKGSKNRRKAVDRLAKLHREISRQRTDWLHKLTTKLANCHAVIAIEDLNIHSMAASAKGSVDAPGKNVMAKAGLNRAILSSGWGEFRRQLAYKLAWRGGELIRVDPRFTSQRCSSCGQASALNRLSQSSFRCVDCGYADNADLNAAKNILTAGYAAWAERLAAPAACGEEVRHFAVEKRQSAASVKQEPTEGPVCE
jgi:putative transposase